MRPLDLSALRLDQHAPRRLVRVLWPEKAGAENLVAADAARGCVMEIPKEIAEFLGACGNVDAAQRSAISGSPEAKRRRRRIGAGIRIARMGLDLSVEQLASRVSANLLPRTILELESARARYGKGVVARERLLSRIAAALETTIEGLEEKGRETA